MSEPKPVYHGDPPAQVDARRRLLAADAQTDADATDRALAALSGEVARLSALAASGALGDAALFAVRHALRDLRARVEALGVGL